MTQARRWMGAGLAAWAALISGGCRDSGDSDARRATKYTIGFSQVTVKEPWRVLFNERLKAAAAAHPEINLIILDANDRTEDQVAQCRTFIRQKADAILISPKEASGCITVVEEATRAGIPVIVLDRDLDTDQYASFVGGDNQQIGRGAGRYAVKLLGGPGKAQGIVYEICGGLASTPAQDRKKGFHDIVEKEPGIQILGGLDGDWKKEKAQIIMQDALKANPKIDIVYAHNDPMAHGAYQAAQAAGRAGQMKFIGIDANPDEGERWVRTGELTATLLYPTPGEKGLEVALDLLAGKKIQKRYPLPTRLFTADNIEAGGEAVE